MCQIERVEDKTHAQLAKQFWKRVRSKCRNAVAKRRRQQREEEKGMSRMMSPMILSRASVMIKKQVETREHSKWQGMQEESNGDISLVQTEMWLEALQEDLEYRRVGGEMVGARANQLMCYLMEMQPGRTPKLGRRLRLCSPGT